MAIQFELNGKPQTVELPGNTPLLWVLHDTLGEAIHRSVRGGGQ